MTTPATPSNPQPAGDDRNLVPVDPTTELGFEDKLHIFWDKNRKFIIGLCVAAFLVVLAKGGLDYMARQKELGVQQAYANATTPEQLKKFVANHGDHTLAGVALLRTADDAYSAGKAADAVAAYDQAIAKLKTGPLAARAQLGRALAKVQAGKAAEATTELKQMADDANQVTAVRAEAAYHLTSLAADSGNAADVQKYATQLMQIDPSSMWSQRAMMLRASLPAPAPMEMPSAASTPSAPAPAPSDAGVKLPGK